MSLPKSLFRSVFIAGGLAVILGNMAPLSRSPVGNAIAWWCRTQCHQDLARTLMLGGYAPPVCSRCLGIYAGLVVAALVGRPRLPLAASAGAAFAFALEVAAEHRLYPDAGNVVRVACGFLFGAAVALRLITIQRTKCAP